MAIALRVDRQSGGAIQHPAVAQSIGHALAKFDIIGAG
jgi:hypothetical protein